MGWSAISGWRKSVILFLLSLFSTLVLLYAGKAVVEYRLNQKMVGYAASTARESDGAFNRVVMIGKSGYLGYSSVRLQYLEDGWISLIGDNAEESSGWKLLSKLTLEPGEYTLTGLKESKENTIALQLRIEDNTGYYHYFYQYNEDVCFTIERPVEAALHVRVYPGVEGIDVKAKPAVYRDD